MKKGILFSLLVALTVFTAACNDNNTVSPSGESDKNEVLSVYTTVYPLTYFAERIGGELISVESIYPAGANEHTFDPTQKDMMALAEADLFFYIGLGLEGFVNNAQKTLANEHVTMVATADYVSDEDLEASEGHKEHDAEEGTEDEHAHEEGTEDEHAHEEGTEDEHAHEEGTKDEHAHEEGTEDEHAHEEGTEDEHAHEEGTEDEHAHEEGTEDEHAHEEEGTDSHDDGTEHVEESHEGHNHGEVDPHLWISPQISIKLATSIKNSLIEKDPENEAFYTENFDALVTDLEKLDADFKEMADASNNKIFFVSHAAFGYLAGTYGLEQVAVSGLNSQDEPSQKELTELVEFAKEKNINTILFEQNVSSNLTEVIQKEIGAEAKTIHNLGVLTQEDIDNKETYFTLMEKNLATLKEALQSAN